MRIMQPKKKKAGRSRRAGVELAQTMSVASQIALLCPSGIDVWMQRELGGYGEPVRPRPGHAR